MSSVCQATQRIEDLTKDLFIIKHFASLYLYRLHNEDNSIKNTDYTMPYYFISETPDDRIRKRGHRLLNKVRNVPHRIFFMSRDHGCMSCLENKRML